MQINRFNQSRQAARRAYDRMSHFYELLAGMGETQFIHLGVELLSAGAGDAVIEIGCGTGIALSEFQGRVGERGIACGLDLSPGMLRKARSALTRHDHKGNDPLICADGAFLPVASGSFTHLFMSFTLELFDAHEIPQVLEECWRVLARGGQLGVVALSKPAQPSRIVRLYEWFHLHFPVYVDCRPIDAENLLQAVGFRIKTRKTKSMWGLPVVIILAIKG